MSSAWDVWPPYFAATASCPTVPFSDFESRPIEFMTSFEMALASANLRYDLLIMLILVGTWKNRFHMLIIYLIPLILTEVILKPIIQQPRPPLAWIDTYGMPSGHATSAGVIFVTIIILHSIGRIRSQWFAVFYSLFMINQAYSRIYLHYHTIAQVLTGFTIGTTLGLLLHHLLPISSKKAKRKAKAVSSPIYFEQEKMEVMGSYEPLIV